MVAAELVDYTEIEPLPSYLFYLWVIGKEKEEKKVWVTEMGLYNLYFLIYETKWKDPVILKLGNTQ